MFVVSIFSISLNAQNVTNDIAIKKQTFETQMNDFVQDYLKDASKVNSLRQKLQDHSDGHDHGEIDIELMLKEQAQQEFKRANLERYKKIYFPDAASVTTYPEICDNGGFEDGFLYYEGYTSIYTHGSSSCNPLYGNNGPISYVQTTMPLTNRFEIVSSGLDPLVGIEKVKFGNRALKLNSQNGHILNCEGDHGVDKIIKEFLVDSLNRNFTVWYAVILENPQDHSNAQPFLNINCDLAPQDELCFDAMDLMCMDIYNDANCTFDSLDVLDWTCHRFSIPESEIGQVASLEIIVADCGLGGHFGYAYIDGICEECFGSSYGSVKLYDTDDIVNNDLFSCDGDSITVCGVYTLPQVCEDVSLDTILIYGVPFRNFIINYDSMSFCFDIDLSDLSPDFCKEIHAEAFFLDDDLDQYNQTSNLIEICEDDFKSYDEPIQITGICNDNNTDPNISDDYYYVTLTISNVGLDNWSLYRELLNSYPNESGYSFLEGGYGVTVIVLGPFLIQEGQWELTVDIEGCLFYRDIYPPEYCSGCTDFGDIEISNITCNAGTPPASDTWDFTLNVPSSSTYGYSIIDATNTIVNPINSYNQNNTYSGFPIDGSCFQLTLQDNNQGTDCGIELIICPPKPCNSESNCEDLEVSINKLICDERNNGTYQALIDVEGEGNSYICYETVGLDPLISGNSNVGSLSSQTLIGPFSDDVFLTVFLCSSPNCSSTACSDPQCFKTIFVPKPDCTDPGFSTNGRSKMPKKHRKNAKVSVIPNPIQNNEFIILSDLDITEFEVYDLSGKRICNGVFEGRRHQVSNVNLESGIYLLKYITINGKAETTKFVKL